MINFSWKKINDKFGWNAQKVLQYFYVKQNISIPAFLDKNISKLVKEEAKKPYPKGSCFILNIDKVLEKAQQPLHLYMYLELASRRNKFDYAIRGMKHLPGGLVYDYLEEWVDLNPMIEIISGNIYFKYEQE